MQFSEFKKLFDESFSNVTPEEFIKHMEALGYKFKDIQPHATDFHSNGVVVNKRDTGNDYDSNLSKRGWKDDDSGGDNDNYDGAIRHFNEY